MCVIRCKGSVWQEELQDVIGKEGLYRLPCSYLCLHTSTLPQVSALATILRML